MKSIDKRALLAIIKNSRMSEDEQRELIQDMLESGTVTENDIAQMMLDDIEKNQTVYRQLFADDAMIRFLWERFKNRPLYLARVLVQTRPDIFYTVGFAFRLILKLRADLGQVWIRPGLPGRRGSTPQEPIKGFENLVHPKVFALDVESQFRDMLYYFSRDFHQGKLLLDEEIALAQTPYDRKVFTEVAKIVERLVRMDLPEVATEIDGHPHPALHVRWWLDQAKDRPRLLNMGDTSTYKTSFASIAMRRFGCRRVLVLTAAHARDNWLREILQYFTDLDESDVKVVEGKASLEDLGDELFTIVGYPLLAQPDTLSKLLAEDFDGLIQDECHYGKGVDASTPCCMEDARVKRAFACLQLVRHLPLKRFIALSATPWENKPEEIAALAVSLRPELFPAPDAFLASGAARQPRFLRELFADQILEIEVREITDLPNIEPKPWIDLFGAVPMNMTANHRKVYEAVYDHPDELEPAQKAMRLLMAATHPRLLANRVVLPPDVAPLLDDWRTSSKLVWIKEFIEQRIATQKIAVLSGLYAEGITKSEDDDDQHVAALLREWFGENRVVVIDGNVPLHGKNGQPSPRQAIIDRWRDDPEARVLLLSVQACPDSVNLSVRTKPESGIEKLSITALSFGWKPWKQPLGRFWRQGATVPVEYRVPVLTRTIDENLLRMNQRKWHAQLLFRALAPMTNDEMKLLTNGSADTLNELLRDSSDYVNIAHASLRGAGESLALQALDELDGAMTRGQALAEHFLAIQDCSASGHIARMLCKTIKVWQEAGLVSLDKILDAGCGPTTMARYLDHPVVSLDYNPYMIKLGCEKSPSTGTYAKVGRLTEMPSDWTGRFELTVSSLVLDLSSLHDKKQNVVERLFILQELVRVTHPQGLVVLTWNADCHTPETFEAWKQQLAKAGMLIRDEYTGLTKATDNQEQQFSFWCLVFSPSGAQPNFTDAEPFRYAHELRRCKCIRGGGHKPLRSVIRKSKVQHSTFEIETRDGVLADKTATERTLASEVKRIWGLGDKGRTLHRSPEEIAVLLGFDWRTWQRALAHGAVSAP